MLVLLNRELSAGARGVGSGRLLFNFNFSAGDVQLFEIAAVFGAGVQNTLEGT